MSKGEKIGINIFLGIIFFIIIFVFVYNLLDNNDFMKISIYQLLSIVCTICISYYLVQKLTDNRRNVDNIDKVIYKLQEQLHNSEVVKVTTMDNRQALILQKSISNKLLYLKHIKQEKIADDIQYVEEQFNKLRELYGNHMTEEDVLKSLEKDFQIIISNIDDKCEKMHIDLYN